jgi:hypothetical protein
MISNEIGVPEAVEIGKFASQEADRNMRDTANLANVDDDVRIG